MSSENMDIVFIKPLKFEDCVKCAKYIKESKIISINLSELEEKDSRRMLDYISGAVSITDYQIVKVSNEIFSAIPGNIKFYVDSASGYGENEEEEIVTFRK